MKAAQIQKRSSVQILILALAALLVLAGCAAGSIPLEEANSPEAQSLAEQLSNTLAAAGLTPPSADTLAVILGVDGGITCLNADGELQLISGLTGHGNPSGMRRVPVDNNTLIYDQAVLQTYCPDKLANFVSVAASLGIELPALVASVPVIDDSGSVEATPESTPESTPEAEDTPEAESTPESTPSS